VARFAFTEEWLSLRASKILPYLAREHEVHYIASGTEVPSADFASVKLFKFPRYQQQNSLRIASAAKRLYKRGMIDFVVDYSYMAWALCNIPFIEIVGGLYHNDFQMKWEKASWFKRIPLPIGYFHYCLPERSCIKRARQIITDNLVNAGIMHKRFRTANADITIVPNGVDESFFNLYAAKDYSKPKLLFVGNLHPMKGILSVAKQFSERKDLDVPFIICGDGPDRTAMQNLARQDSRIDYRGRVSHKEILEIEKQTNIFVFPSLTEGCPNALLEAMASGHACITYDAETIRPVIGNSGLEAHANQADHVIDYCAMLLNDRELIQSKAAASHERSKNFSWEKCASAISTVVNCFAFEK